MSGVLKEFTEEFIDANRGQYSLDHLQAEMQRKRQQGYAF